MLLIVLFILCEFVRLIHVYTVDAKIPFDGRWGNMLVIISVTPLIM